MIRIRPDVSALLKPRDVPAVRAALQKAIELEHATIPPYLYALYSLYSLCHGTNSAVADIIRSVVSEEMLHLTLAANILNGIGGSPLLDSPSFIPRYPGPLPGSVGDVVVDLAPCSRDPVIKTFMDIEKPEHPLASQRGAAAASGPLTIGQFYQLIRATIIALGDKAFFREPHHQITPDLIKNAVVVTDVATACQAIDTIIDQGEGTARSPFEVVGTGYAHYYRFAEIFYGRRLIPNPKAGPSTPPEERYIYGGDRVRLDEASVLRVPTNPTTAGYPDGSAARKACVTFNYTYTSLLKCLHVALNGEPDKVRAATGLMMSLRHQAVDMMTGTTTGNTPTGPTFEWQPVNS